MISETSYVIIRKKEFMKLVNLEKCKSIRIGSQTIDLTNIIGKPFYTIFEIVPDANDSKLFQLNEIVKSYTQNPNERLNFNNFQVSNPSDTVNKMVQDSTTFHQKTEYSQAKYLNKKDKKYFNFIQIFKPSVRLINEIFFEQRKSKIICIRNDNLAAIFEYANIEANGSYFLYDKGSNGSIAVGILEKLAKPHGNLIHCFSGQYFDRASFCAIDFDRDLLRKIDSSTLVKHINRNFECVETVAAPAAVAINGDEVGTKTLCCDNSPTNRIVFDQMKNHGVDAIILASRDHPKQLVDVFVPFLKNGKPLVVFSLVREPLECLFVHLKRNQSFIFVRILSTMLRYQQILPDRTHPYNKMTTGGFLLVAYKVQKSSE